MSIKSEKKFLTPPIISQTKIWEGINKNKNEEEKTNKEYFSKLNKFEKINTYPFVLVIDHKSNYINDLLDELKQRHFSIEFFETIKEATTSYKNLVNQKITFEAVIIGQLLIENVSGKEFIKEIKNNSRIKNVPIFSMNGKDNFSIVRDYYANEKYEIIGKAVSHDLMIKILESKKCPIEGYNLDKKLKICSDEDIFLIKRKIDNSFFILKKIKCLVNEDEFEIKIKLEKLQNLNIPTVIKLITYNFVDEFLYLVEEYAEHGSLERKIMAKKEEANELKKRRNSYRKQYNNSNQAFETDKIILWISEIILGIYSLHEKGYIHKDISSKNILICNNDLVKIKFLNVSNKENQIKDINYAPPELIRYNKYLTSSDIWDLGVLLYELVSLKKPFDDKNVEKIKENILEEEYVPLPKNTDKRIKRLLELTLVNNKYRASAENLLQLEFIREKINYLFDEKIISDNDLFKKINSLPILDNNDRFPFEKPLDLIRLNQSKSTTNIPLFVGDKKKEENKDKNEKEQKSNKELYKLTKVSSESTLRRRDCSTMNISKFYKINHHLQEQKDYEEYYKLFRAVQLIFYSLPKKLISSGYFFSTEELIEDYYMNNLDAQFGITNEDIQNLKKKGYIIEKIINGKIFFSLIKFQNENIDNSLNFPVEPEFVKYTLDNVDPVILSSQVLIKVKELFDDFKFLLESEEAEEKDKAKIYSGKKIYNAYTCIRTLQKLNLKGCSKEKKLSIMLNVFQIMSLHLIMKQGLIDVQSNEINFKRGFFSEIKNMINILISPNNAIEDITYNLAGHLITLYELKHIVIRRNRVPPGRYMRLAYNNDPRINFLDGSWEEIPYDKRVKILTLCFDPQNVADANVYSILQPLGICFSESTLDSKLDNSFSCFVKENVWIEENFINVPGFFRKYLYDLDNDENKLISFFIQEIYKDKPKKYNFIINNLNSQKISINYYNEFFNF